MITIILIIIGVIAGIFLGIKGLIWTWKKFMENIG